MRKLTGNKACKIFPVLLEMKDNEKLHCREICLNRTRNSLKINSKTWELEDMEDIMRIGNIGGLTDPEFKEIFNKIYSERLNELSKAI
jgi:hypothetical protein